MAQINKETLEFLTKLKKNNNRDWFTANKEKYVAAHENFTTFVGDLINQISKFDKSVASLDPKKCVFRIYRDVRFSKDKSPYKTNFGAAMAGGGKGLTGKAGFYIHLEAGVGFLAGGVHMPEPDRLKLIREDVSMEGKKFLKIINDKTFKNNFKQLSGGDMLKTAPKGFDKEDPMMEYLKYKDFIAMHKLDEKAILSPKFASYCTDIFKTMVPFISFLNASLPLGK
ncbi:MAG TPA: DUF2461 domain-containing protein [Bacteroidia bacterium]|nr:DUF2461 domain-containing protein [Bacteroidia bacterium]